MLKQAFIINQDNDFGAFGKALEKAMTGKAHYKAGSKVDYWHDHCRFEVKTGAGQLDIRNGKLAHCDLVLYVPVVTCNADGKVNAYEQEGFIVRPEIFIDLLREVGLFRENKVTSDGYTTAAIQTFWNRKQNKPHSIKAYNRLIDALYEQCEVTLEQWLEEEFGD